MLIGCMQAKAEKESLPVAWGGGWVPDPGRVKSLSESRSTFNYREERVPAIHLPDLLTSGSGDAVTSVADWENQRRPEVMALLADQVYGRVAGLPERMTMQVAEVDPQALGGRAVAKRIHIHLGHGNRELRMELKLFLPAGGVKPVPIFLLINNRGPENLDMSRKNRNGFWPVETVIERGYGIAGFQNSDLDPDQHDSFQNGVHGLFQTEVGPHSWGALAAWGWGASRAMDYFEADPDIDASRVALLGHSRGGKSALWAGARDSRFSVVISNNSGCGGAALSQRRFGETVARINQSFPHWFCGAFDQYNGLEPTMPFDQHFLLAAIAPRAVYVASASNDLWADPRGEYLALFHAGPAFELYGDAPLPVDEPPAPGYPVSSGRRGYHMRAGGHGLEVYDWERYMEFAARYWATLAQ